MDLQNYLGVDHKKVNRYLELLRKNKRNKELMELLELHIYIEDMKNEMRYDEKGEYLIGRHQVKSLITKLNTYKNMTKGDNEWMEEEMQ